MKRVIFSLITIISLIITSAEAATLKGGYGACLSEDLFDQFVSASVKKDKRAFKYLLTNGCIITKEGIEISILDTTWTGTTKVRAYVGAKAFILWTYRENILR